jgi:hypothetical protein
MYFLAALFLGLLAALPASARSPRPRPNCAPMAACMPPRTLIAAKAPLDHVNNPQWTALIESIVLGDGGSNHTETLRALVDAGANVNIPDDSGATPLRLARNRGYRKMVVILEKSGAK